MFKRLVFNVLKRSMATGNSPILVENLATVRTIGINRPEKRNCLDTQTAHLLGNAIKDFEHDETSLVAVLYGTGGNFCSGFDLSEIAQSESVDTSVDAVNELSVLSDIHHVQKPMVAALNGFTVAGGLELALLCDLRVMEDTAVVGLYGRRFGVPLVDGATVRLPAMVGLSRALDLILTGRSLQAKEAFEWGIANRIVACGTGLGQAIQLAGSLTKFPQACLASDRQSTYNASFNEIFDRLLKYEKENSKRINIKEMVEGAKRFMGGLGKHGKSYHLRQKESYGWEKEYTSNFKSKL